MQATIIACMSQNRVIGDKGKIPWREPTDMARFKSITMGHAVVMGRKTWDSLPGNLRPLVGRQNIIVTRNPYFSMLGAHVVNSLQFAMVKAQKVSDRAFIIGGAEIYAEAIRLGIVEQMILTILPYDCDGDTLFPKINGANWIDDVVTTPEGHNIHTFTRTHLCLGEQGEAASSL